MGWVKVKDKMPTIEKEYWGAQWTGEKDHNGKSIYCFLYLVTFDEGEFWLDDEDKIELTHWMEPEFPKEK